MINLLADVIKDLIRYLRRDDDSHTIRRFLGRTKLLRTDLVKILVHHVNNTELWDILLRYVLMSTNKIVCSMAQSDMVLDTWCDSRMKWIPLSSSRLMINLTSPVSVIYNDQIPTEKTMYSLYQQIISHLQEYKVALSDDNVWFAVSGRLAKLLSVVRTKFYIFRIDRYISHNDFYKIYCVSRRIV